MCFKVVTIIERDFYLENKEGLDIVALREHFDKTGLYLVRKSFPLLFSFFVGSIQDFAGGNTVTEGDSAKVYSL